MMKKNKLSIEELCDILANSDGYLKRNTGSHRRKS